MLELTTLVIGAFWLIALALGLFIFLISIKKEKK